MAYSSDKKNDGDNICENCYKKGITLLPNRWGYTFQDNSVKSFGRLLREGYIYILDNKNNWHGYIVTSKRDLKPFNVNNIEKTPDLPQQVASCYASEASCDIFSSLIIIPDPQNDIQTLWLAYSPVKWTEAIISNHQNNVDNAKANNMIEVPVSATKSTSEDSLGSANLQSAGGYDLWSCDPDEEGKIRQYFATEYFGKINPFTSQRYQPDKKNEKDYLSTALTEIDTNRDTDINRVLNVYFNDPVGNLIDLNEFMIQSKLMNQPTQDDIYKYTVASLIKTLQHNIDEKTKSDAQHHIDRVNNITELTQPWPRWEEGDGPSEAERLEEEKARQEGAIKYKERQVQAAWSNYSQFIRENEMNEWVKNFEAYSKNRILELNNILDKLASEYKSIFESEYLKSTMIFNFDKEDYISRVYYTLTVQQFLGSTATIPMLSDLYDFHLSKKTVSDDNNYLARALAFNQDEVVNHIDSLPPITSGLTPSEVMTASWAGLLYTGSATIFSKYDAIAGQVGATVSLAEQLAVPFLKNYRTGQTLNGLMLSQKEYLFGYHHEKALIIVKGQGSYADARKALINGIMHITGDGKLPTRIRESVNQALKTSGEMGRLNKPFTQSFIYYIDKNELRAGMNVYQSSNKAYADKGILRQVIDRSVLTTPELFDQGYKDYKRFEDITNRKIDQAVRANYFGAMLQTVACVFLVSAFFQAKTQEERLVEGSKAAAGLMMLLAGSLELRGNASKLLESELKLQRGAGVANLGSQIDKAQSTAKSLSRGARLLSLGGAAIFAGFDVNSALKARANDDKLLGAAYIGSAVTGVGSTAFFMMSGSVVTGIGVVLLIGFIGINLFIGYWKKTGMEDWLNLGIWGVEDDGWSFEHTLEQFDRAVVGEDIDKKDN